MTSSSLVIPDNYKFISTIGKGGAGIVIKAKSTLGKEVALKVLYEDGLSEQKIKRFKREIKIHSGLENPNIIEILDFNIEDDKACLFYSMPLAEKNFETLLKEYQMDSIGKMSDADVEFYFEQILNAVEYAHKEGVIHRDLKPLNILVFEDDNLIKISDFGLGKFINRDTTEITRTSTNMGSECYAAPEQYIDGDAKSVDERADIYSLGKILYQMITFDLPVVIDPDKIKDSKYRIIINKATQANREKRFSNVSELRNMFELINGREKSLKPSTREFNDLVSKYLLKRDENILKSIVEILISNTNDYSLYSKDFMNIDYTIIKDISELFSSEFNEIINSYIKHIHAEHPFSYIDKISNFMLNIIKLISDIETYKNAIRELIWLAAYHNRFYAGDKIANYIEMIEDVDVEKSLLLLDILKEDIYMIKWIKNYINAENVNTILKEAF
ncbi:serine/threonine-protein kinase [Clostridium baratii]|uniref:non-specific serine/threonine protein kinase n=1 Tax=Clostridium baratii TaxID=1561 RepID=A0A174QRS8_9CLOT|nr:serine/threonine-protein kinase [Clostridium baratii]CUP73588.1 serine/threonine protein kinase [Clostridium baratii]